MTAAVSNRSRTRSDLRAGMADGAAFSLMVGMGETYLAAFALALGLGGTAAGLVATVPMLAGALMQLAGPWAVGWLGSHKRWVVLCASCQGASLALAPLALLGMGSAVFAGFFVFLAATLYWACGLATGPAWNTWMEQVIPHRVRTHYFAGRVRLSQFCLLVGFAGGGLLLQAGSFADARTLSGFASWTMAAFVTLFVTAAACRLLSASFLARQSDPTTGPLDDERVRIVEWIRRLRRDAGARLVVYLLAMQVAVQISGPFFTPYMLSKLEMTYFDYMSLLGIAFCGKVISLRLWGRLAQRWGARALLWIGGLGIIPVSGLWVFSGDYWFLALVQVISGLAWAAYELAFLLMFFETIPRRERTGVLTIYNLGNATALVFGAAIGAVLLQAMNESVAAYLALFGISSLARLTTVVLLVRVPDLRFKIVPPATRTLAIRPNAAAMDRPILPSMPNGSDPAIPALDISTTTASETAV